MSTSLPYHSQGFVGFQLLNYKFPGKYVIAELCRKKSNFKCKICKSNLYKTVAWAVLTHNLWVLARLDHNCESTLKAAA